jgi:hypothetical protein
VVNSNQPLTITSSIISGNGPANSSTSDLYATGALTTLTYSAIGTATGLSLSPASGHNLPFGVDLKLGPLADNGGPTETHALLTGSPAIDAGSNPAGLVFDQRGYNYARVAGPAADIGAFEAQVPGRVQSVVVNDGAAQRSRVTSLTLTFDHLVTLPADPAAAFRLSRTGPDGTVGDVALSVDLSGSTATQTVVRLTFSGPLTQFGSLADGDYALTIRGSQVTGPGGLLLDGDGDGAPGGDYAYEFFCLYGDVNGDRAVNGLDLAAFRSAFGSTAGTPLYLAYLDFNGDGVINGLDLAQFRTRFGTVLP